MENQKTFNINTSGCCVVCSSKCNLVCHRCGTFYCTKKCHLNDWQCHRYICFAVPSLVNPVECSAFVSQPKTRESSVNAEDMTGTTKLVAPKTNEVFNPVHSKTAMGEIVGGDKQKSIHSGKDVPNETSGDSSSICNGNQKITNKKIFPPIFKWPANGSNVCITSFVSSNRCMFRDASANEEIADKALRDKIDLLGNQQPILHNPNNSEFALAKWNGRFERVKVIGISTNGFKLKYLDLGIITDGKTVEMREITEEILNWPCRVFEYQLSGVPFLAFSPELQTFTKSFIGNLFRLYFAKSYIVLTDLNTKISLNTQIIKFHAKMKQNKQISLKENIQTVMNVKVRAVDTIVNENGDSMVETIKCKSTENQTTELEIAPIEMKGNATTLETSKKEINNGISELKNQSILRAPFELHPIVVSSEFGLDVLIVDNKKISRGVIGAFDSKYAREFSKICIQLTHFNDTHSHKPKLEEYVIAKFEDGWYRARVTKIKSNPLCCTYDVMYIDFPNVSTVTETDIRRYPADLNIPCYTSICIIEDFPHKLNKAQLDYLDEKFQIHSIIHIDSVKYLKEMALVKSKTLINALAKLS